MDIYRLFFPFAHPSDAVIFSHQVDENMKVAQKRNAVQEGMFYFRKDIFKGEHNAATLVWC